LTASSPNFSLASRLRDLHQDALTSIESAVSSHSDGLGRVLQLDLDIKIWESRLTGCPEIAQLSAARRDLALAIYAGATGAYSHAYAGLRTFLELSFAAVYFSANEFARRQWLSDRKDFSWSEALSADTGILSAAFIKEFNETAVPDAKEYADNAAKCYRHCSQFIHGKSAVTRLLPESFSYSQTVLEDWITTAQKAAESVVFLLFCRYSDEINLNEHHDLVETLVHSFVHLKSVRQTIGLPVD
jgi:hypothetical protein